MKNLTIIVKILYLLFILLFLLLLRFFLLFSLLIIIMEWESQLVGGVLKYTSILYFLRFLLFLLLILIYFWSCIVFLFFFWPNGTIVGVRVSLQICSGAYSNNSTSFVFRNSLKSHFLGCFDFFHRQTYRHTDQPTKVGLEAPSPELKNGL